jgi:hypothetical protein
MGIIAKQSVPGAKEAGFAGFVGTSSGWTEFGGFADTLDVGKFEEVIHLWEHGYTKPLDALEKQLVAIVKLKMKPGAKAVAEALLGIVKRRDPAATMLIVCDEAAEVPAAEKRRGR